MSEEGWKLLFVIYLLVLFDLLSYIHIYACIALIKKIKTFFIEQIKIPVFHKTRVQRGTRTRDRKRWAPNRYGSNF